MFRYIFFVYLFSLFPVLGEEKLLHYFEKITLNKEFWAGIFVLSGIAVGIGVYTTVVVETAVIATAVPNFLQ